MPLAGTAIRCGAMRVRSRRVVVMDVRRWSLATNGVAGSRVCGVLMRRHAVFVLHASLVGIETPVRVTGGGEATRIGPVAVVMSLAVLMTGDA